MMKPSIKKYFNDACYYLLFALWWTMSHLPMCVLYFFSDIMQFLLYYVIRYRRKIVRKNLISSFPDMKFRQLWLTERRFYLHFCDIFFESFKYFSISQEEMKRRMRFVNVELLNESFRNGKSFALFLGHYANWEWVSSLSLWIDPEVAVTTQIYHPLENEVFNRLINFTRSRFGGYNIPMDQSMRYVLRIRKETGKPVGVGFIADQSPLTRNIHYWSPFLNHLTPFFTGCERLSKKLDMDVYYLDVQRVKRGYYTATLKLMSNTVKNEPEFNLTEMYLREIESTIRKNPPYWLWSHNRWKRTFEVWYDDMYDYDMVDRIEDMERSEVFTKAIELDQSMKQIVEAARNKHR